MTRLQVWECRATEEANHFNPAFCGALTYEFIKSYCKHTSKKVNFVLPFCVLPIVLHPETRRKLPTVMMSSMFSWLEREPAVRVGFTNRATNLAPYVREGILFSLQRHTIILNDDGTMSNGSQKSSFTDGFLLDATSEVKEIVSDTRRLGKWFAGAGDVSTILSAWKILP